MEYITHKCSECGALCFTSKCYACNEVDYIAKARYEIRRLKDKLEDIKGAVKCIDNSIGKINRSLIK